MINTHRRPIVAMRQAVATLLLAIFLPSCTSPNIAVPTPTVFVSGPSALSAAVAANDFGVGHPRVPFVLFQGAQPLRDATAVLVTAFDLSSGTAVPSWSGEATAYADYDIPYWVAYPDLPHAGYWGFVASITLANGSQESAQFTVEALADASAPELGEIPPASRNRTLAVEPDVSKLTSDPFAEPALYELTIADALANDLPTVVTFATPAFCESRLCAPVVNSVKAVRQDAGEQANFIHIEVYKDFETFEYVDEMDEWKLTSEPWTFVLDRQGRVTARFGGPVSPAELRAALQPLLTP